MSTAIPIVFPDLKKGYTCSCCGAFIKTYVRKFNSNMALALAILYRNTIASNSNDFVHLEELIIKSGHKRCGDFSYLVHYGFIEKLVSKRNDGSKRNGYYRIAQPGVMFVLGKSTAKEKFVMDGGKFRGFEGGDITFLDALSKKFNYNELMDM